MGHGLGPRYTDEFQEYFVKWQYIGEDDNLKLPTADLNNLDEAVGAIMAVYDET